MRKAILIKFIQVLLAALVVNTAIFYVVTSSIMLKDIRRQMSYTLEIMDRMLDYGEDLNGQIRQLDRLPDSRRGRFTIIRPDGTVAADSQAGEGLTMENHLEREEVREALRDGQGFSNRQSATTGGIMLYAAQLSGDGRYLLRMATPFSGMREYLTMLLPAIWLSFAVTLGVSAFAAERFSSSVTRPLKEISQEMGKMDGDYTDFRFESCQYPEINVIADTTTQMSQNVKEYLDRIEREKQIRQEFFSNASHELKTPITSIQGYAELLESGMAKDEGMRMDFIRRIKKEAVHMTGLINDILTVSRLESEGTAAAERSEFPMAPVLEDVAASFRPLARRRQISLHTECEAVSIRADAGQMAELLGNLMSNAVKYNRPGGHVWASVCREGDWLAIRVRDDGMGIPEEARERVFERFYRVDKGRSRKQGGTGLGLSIVKHLVGHYHGTIEMSTELGKGTEFTVRLPLE